MEAEMTQRNLMLQGGKSRSKKSGRTRDDAPFDKVRARGEFELGVKEGSSEENAETKSPSPWERMGSKRPEKNPVGKSATDRSQGKDIEGKKSKKGGKMFL